MNQRIRLGLSQGIKRITGMELFFDHLLAVHLCLEQAPDYKRSRHTLLKENVEEIFEEVQNG